MSYAVYTGYAEHMEKEIKRVGTHNKGRGVVGWQRPKGYVTNDEFAEQDAAFKDACSKASIPNTKRQASKWRRKFGKAYRNK